MDKATINVKRCWLLALFALSPLCPPFSLPVCCRSVPNEANAKQKANKRNRKRKKTRTKNCSILYCASRRKCPLSKLIRPTCVQATACVCGCECVFYFNLRVKHLHCASCHAPRQIMNFVNAVAALGIPLDKEVALTCLLRTILYIVYILNILHVFHIVYITECICIKQRIYT